eukprot:9976868-Karenia_brevis.AAC.1
MLRCAHDRRGCAALSNKHRNLGNHNIPAWYWTSQLDIELGAANNITWMEKALDSAVHKTSEAAQHGAIKNCMA